MIYVYRRDVTARYEVRVEANSEEEANTKLSEGNVVSDEEVNGIVIMKNLNVLKITNQHLK